jgi:hypothetical protein
MSSTALSLKRSFYRLAHGVRSNVAQLRLEFLLVHVESGSPQPWLPSVSFFEPHLLRPGETNLVPTAKRSPHFGHTASRDARTFSISIFRDFGTRQLSHRLKRRSFQISEGALASLA